jgi:hypothetical protein
MVAPTALKLIPPRRRRHWIVPLAATVLPVVAYVLTYVVLRAAGVYYPFYNQGSWDIDGTTHVTAIDVVFVPALLVEQELQNSLRWLPEPTGG